VGRYQQYVVECKGFLSDSHDIWYPRCVYKPAIIEFDSLRVNWLACNDCRRVVMADMDIRI
jgi:hypothetical protein